MVIQDHSVDGLFNGWLVEMPTILDSLFHKVVNTTSSPIGVGGGGEPQSGGTFQFKKMCGQITSFQAVFSSTYHKM